MGHERGGRFLPFLCQLVSKYEAMLIVVLIIVAQGFVAGPTGLIATMNKETNGKVSTKTEPLGCF